MSDLEHLHFDKRNARKHNPRNLGMIERSLGEVGASRSIVIDENDTILAGNGTVEVAQRLGMKLQVVESDGETLIAVKRRNLTPEQKQRLALFDNRSAETAEWDTDVLGQLLAENHDALEGMFTKDELADLIDTILAPGDGGDDFDTTPQDGPTRVQRGELWQLGEHRLLCGDSTNADDVARLMDGERATLLATDPPYNVGIDYGNDTDDNKITAEYEAFSRGWFDVWQAVSDRQIVTPGYNNLASWMRFFDKPYHVAPWTKTNSMTRGHVSLFACYEPVLFYGKPWKRTRGNDVFNYPVSAQSLKTGESLTKLHPCPKPLAMWVDLLESYTEPSDVVSDAFGGSGKMVIAAHRTGRRAYLCELSPEYCDVILRRFEAETGQTAQRVDDGRT